MPESKKLRILRRARGEEKGSFEEYSYDLRDEDDTVSTALMHISLEISKAGGRELSWEHSCLQKKCGACAMVICDIPSLACKTKLMDLPEIIKVEPLRKFPVVEDLIVDRSVMPKSLKRMHVFPVDEGHSHDDEGLYNAMRCLQCGVCLEVCPNYPFKGYGGMAAMASFSQIVKKTDKKDSAEAKELSKEYKKNVYEGCGKSLACQKVCPANLPIDDLMSRTNRALVWGRLI